MALFIANNGQLQAIKGIYYGMSEDYINAKLFHNLVPKTATEIKFLHAFNNPDLTNYQRIGYADNNNFIEVWNNGTKYILINPRNNYIYAPVSCFDFMRNYTALTNCVLDNFDTSNTNTMETMFYNCTKLVNLDLSNFNTQNVTNTFAMFCNCGKLAYIISKTFNIAAITSSNMMFINCNRLVGGNGTTYSSSHTNAEYARIDGENGLSGYFTAPTN